MQCTCILRQRLVSAVLIAAMLGMGCVRTREIKVGRFQPGMPNTTYWIQRDGWYRVNWKVRDRFEGVRHTTRYLTAGTIVGFETDADGGVVAIFEEERIPLGAAPHRARYCCWYHRSKEETQFAREIRSLLEATGDTLAVVAIGAGVATLAVAVIALELRADDDCQPSRHDRR